jgi:hypothetical protein
MTPRPIIHARYDRKRHELHVADNPRFFDGISYPDIATEELARAMAYRLGAVWETVQ